MVTRGRRSVSEGKKADGLPGEEVSIWHVWGGGGGGGHTSWIDKEMSNVGGGARRWGQKVFVLCPAIALCVDSSSGQDAANTLHL